MSAKWEMHPSRRDGNLVHVVTEEDGTEVGLVWNAENATLASAAPDLLAALAGCADALREAGKDFAQANKLAARPNLYELHEQAARAAIAKATGGAA